MLFTLMASTAQAQSSVSGRELLDQCSALDTQSWDMEKVGQATACLTFIRTSLHWLDLFEGILDEVAPDADKRMPIRVDRCMPEGVTVGQLADVIVKYLEDHPEKQHEMAYSIYIDAMREAFC